MALTFRAEYGVQDYRLGDDVTSAVIYDQRSWSDDQAQLAKLEWQVNTKA